MSPRTCLLTLHRKPVSILNISTNRSMPIVAVPILVEPAAYTKI